MDSDDDFASAGHSSEDDFMADPDSELSQEEGTCSSSRLHHPPSAIRTRIRPTPSGPLARTVSMWLCRIGRLP